MLSDLHSENNLLKRHETHGKPHSFSVVIPTRGRYSLIERILTSLEKAAIYSKATIEVIIIDDSPYQTEVKIKSLCQRYGARFIKGPPSVREKRNIGIRESKGEIIFFVDSDCEVSCDIFDEHLKMYNKTDTGGVLGITEFTGKETATWKIVKRTKFLDAFFFAKTLQNYVDSAPWGTCTNLSLKKEILEKVGGFDTKFPFRLGGDDTDLGIRINKAGYKIKMNPNAMVFHTRETWNNFVSVAKRAFRWGRMDYFIFYKKHKDKISLIFCKPITIFLVLLSIGLIRAAITNFLFALFLPLAWLLSFLFLNSLFKNISLKEPLKNICFEMPAQFLHFIFDFGTALESIKNKSLSALFKAPLDDPRQAIILWNEKVREAWSTVLSALIVLLIFMAV
jgi:GT2 family glycosyltransferase